VRLYEQSLDDCESVPNNTHSISARLQLIGNLEAQLVHSAASIQNMEAKANVIKSLTPTNTSAESSVAQAKQKMDTIRQQLEQTRVHHEQLQEEVDHFTESSNALAGELKSIGDSVQSLSSIPFFKQAKQHQAEKLEVSLYHHHLNDMCR